MFDNSTWAPASLTGSISLSFMDMATKEGGSAAVTIQGLQFRAKGYRLSSFEIPLKNDFYILPGQAENLGSDGDTQPLRHVIAVVRSTGLADEYPEQVDTFLPPAK